MVHEKISTYEIKENDVFIIDTNVWIFLLNISTLSVNQNIIDKYSLFIEKIKEKDNKIVILSMGISELFNRYIKSCARFVLDLKGIKGENAYKTHYRNTPLYEKDKKFIIDNIKDNILPLVEPISDDLNLLDIEKVLSRTRKNYDFNDNYFACFAEKFNYKLITHDFDFIKTYNDLNFTVITA